MKPREEYDKEALLVVVADLEQIGRNLLFARRNIWFYLFMCVYIVLRACVHTLAEKREERIKFKKVRHKRREARRRRTTTS